MTIPSAEWRKMLEVLQDYKEFKETTNTNIATLNNQIKEKDKTIDKQQQVIGKLEEENKLSNTNNSNSAGGTSGTSTENDTTSEAGRALVAYRNKELSSDGKLAIPIAGVGLTVAVVGGVAIAEVAGVGAVAAITTGSTALATTIVTGVGGTAGAITGTALAITIAAPVVVVLLIAGGIGLAIYKRDDISDLWHRREWKEAAQGVCSFPSDKEKVRKLISVVDDRKLKMPSIGHIIRYVLIEIGSRVDKVVKFAHGGEPQEAENFKALKRNCLQTIRDEQTVPVNKHDVMSKLVDALQDRVSYIRKENKMPIFSGKDEISAEDITEGNQKLYEGNGRQQADQIGALKYLMETALTVGIQAIDEGHTDINFGRVIKMGQRIDKGATSFAEDETRRTKEIDSHKPAKKW